MTTLRSKRSAPRQAAWVRVVREPLTAEERLRLPKQIKCPQDSADVLQERVNVELVEVFWAIYLNAQSRVIGIEEITRGILNASLVHPREVFRGAIAAGASGIVVAHNHPSGDPTPSPDDQVVTRQLVAGGGLLDIPVYDHLILTATGKLYSFASDGKL